jgi:hypothetical protein
MKSTIDSYRFEKAVPDPEALVGEYHGGGPVTEAHGRSRLAEPLLLEGQCEVNSAVIR